MAKELSASLKFLWIRCAANSDDDKFEDDDDFEKDEPEPPVKKTESSPQNRDDDDFEDDFDNERIDTKNNLRTKNTLGKEEGDGFEDEPSEIEKKDEPKGINFCD